MNKKDFIKRVIAILTVVLLLACIVITLIFAITGNKNFMGMLMITLILPVFLWLFLFFFKRSKDRSNET